MALGWAIYGTWNWWTWWLHEILEHEMSLYIFLNTNNSNNTNVFWHTDLTDLTLCSWCLNTRFFLNTNFTHEFYLAHGSHFLSTRISRISLTDFEPSARCEWQLVVVVDSLWLLTRCGCWLIVVIDSLWLLTRCGYWLIVVIDSLWLLACCGYWLVMF